MHEIALSVHKAMHTVPHNEWNEDKNQARLCFAEVSPSSLLTIIHD